MCMTLPTDTEETTTESDSLWHNWVIQFIFGGHVEGCYSFLYLQLDAFNVYTEFEKVEKSCYESCEKKNFVSLVLKCELFKMG